jgi:hypothetical protein
MEPGTRGCDLYFQLPTSRRPSYWRPRPQRSQKAAPVGVSAAAHHSFGRVGLGPSWLVLSGGAAGSCRASRTPATSAPSHSCGRAGPGSARRCSQGPPSVSHSRLARGSKAILGSSRSWSARAARANYCERCSTHSHRWSRSCREARHTGTIRRRSTPAWSSRRSCRPETARHVSSRSAPELGDGGGGVVLEGDGLGVLRSPLRGWTWHLRLWGSGAARTALIRPECGARPCRLCTGWWPLRRRTWPRAPAARHC